MSQLPHDVDAERAVLGALLIDPHAILAVQDIGLQAGDFYIEKNRWVYAAIHELASNYRPVDYITVVDVLRNMDGHLQALGGEAYLTGLMGVTPTSVHAVHYGQIVKDTARRRAIIAVCASIAGKAQERNDVDALKDEIGREFIQAVSDTEPRSHLYGSDDVLVNYLANQDERLERLKSNPASLVGTGWKGLDDVLDCIEPGYILVFGARTGVGKTMALEKVAEHNAQLGSRVAFYHLELSHQTMLDRCLARHSGVRMSELRRGDKSKVMTEAMDRIRPWQKNIVYVHCPGWSAERIIFDIARLCNLGLCQIAIVDYLGKLKLPASKHNASMLIGQQVEMLKTCAEQQEIPVITASQVSRDYKTRGDKRPQMGDLRNSGEIEEKVNQVVMLHRPAERKDLDFGTEIIQAHVDKNTNGRVGNVELVHIGGRFLLGEPTSESQQDEWPGF